MDVIGNTPQETAYHEAGHIVIAAAVGLDLRPQGILMFEAGDLAGGIACYWEDAELEQVLKALRAGQMAQLRRFPRSEIRGGIPDAKAFSEAVAQVLPAHCAGDMFEKTNGEVQQLFSKHWATIVAVAETLLRKDWVPIVATDQRYLNPDEQLVVKRKKQLAGDEIVEILHQHGILARVRNPEAEARVYCGPLRGAGSAALPRWCTRS